MADFDLGQRFDVVTCLFSSIGYLQTVNRLQSACQSFARSLQPSGMLVLEPWLSPDQYWTNKLTLNVAEDDGLKIAWMYTHARSDDLSVFDIHFLVGTPRGVEHFVETHVMRLFAPEEYAEALEAAGFDWKFSAEGLFGRGVYTGVLR